MTSKFRSPFNMALGSLLALAGLRACTMALPAKAIVVTPAGDAVFASSRQVNALALEKDGALWVGTSGGVLRRDPAGTWRKWTRREGLPSQEVLNIATDETGVQVQLPTGMVQLKEGKWIGSDSGQGKTFAISRHAVEWHGAMWRATLDGLLQESLSGADNKADMPTALAKTSHTYPLPPSTGTHISALLPCGDVLLAALFGDGLWEFDGAQWHRSSLTVPEDATDITALAGDKAALWVGTRRAGVWRSEAGQWTQYLQDDEPFEHNAQNMVSFGGVLWFSTLEDGLVARTPTGWQRFGMESLSSMAPRQLVVWKDALYVRHGGGKVDRYDGARWQRDVFPALPRRKVLFLTADQDRLYLVQWGGWSEWDGKTWQHFLNLPALQGLPLMNLLPDGERVWIGTQSRGVVEVRREMVAAPIPAGKNDTASPVQQALSPSLPKLQFQVNFHDERRGLNDDWITCMTRWNGTLWVGTFVGGLCRFDGKRWQPLKELAGENVTALETDGAGSLYIATRHGLWRRSVDGKMMRVNEEEAWLDREVQTLCHVAGGLWVGTRTGLFFIADKRTEQDRSAIRRVAAQDGELRERPATALPEGGERFR